MQSSSRTNSTDYQQETKTERKEEEERTAGRLGGNLIQQEETAGGRPKPGNQLMPHINRPTGCFSRAERAGGAEAQQETRRCYRPGSRWRIWGQRLRWRGSQVSGCQCSGRCRAGTQSPPEDLQEGTEDH